MIGRCSLYHGYLSKIFAGLHCIELRSSKCKCPLAIVVSYYLISSVPEYSSVLVGSQNGSMDGLSLLSRAKAVSLLSFHSTIHL